MYDAFVSEHWEALSQPYVAMAYKQYNTPYIKLKFQIVGLSFNSVQHFSYRCFHNRGVMEF